MKRKLKTHCFQGHELSSENLYVVPSTGGRQCRICRDARKCEWQARTLYDVQDRDALLASQGGKCKLCGRSDCHWGKGFQDVWHIDHIAGTKIVRGVLCASCNLLTGQIEKNLALSQEAIRYVKGNHGIIDCED